ncbi:P-loop ATPase, Sll1717 family [Yersinia enterocolitica]|uniref:P-loop ATPase, Sll1717 family n=1 Tax=Yersinia enterocolitica TaxID=630 RepID=UPI0005E2BFA4|nr:hypothetical protein [Yersinia enterocolitica]CQJ20620.1 Uncharacterised protein [Yersinia enterocolitica]
MEKNKGFYAYPANPIEIGQCIEATVSRINQTSSQIFVSTWKQMNIIGQFISEQVLSIPDNSDFLIADITDLNFNVTYEIGYAIGKSKKIFLTKNKSIYANGLKIEDVGIFDTLGYHEYQNTQELQSFVSSIINKSPLELSSVLNRKAPVYLLDTPFITDWSGRIISRIKKSGYIYRDFNPNEIPRLSAFDAISQVSSSYGVIVPLLSSNSVGHNVHNLRAAFIAGLSDGMGKALCIIQNGDNPVPLDYRDFVNVTYHPDDINEFIGQFASEVAKAFQQSNEESKPKEKSFLKKLNLGATSAENEMRDLDAYYLETDQYLKALRGEAHLVIGRKGSGKSAIFLQIRDRERDRNRSKNIVLDLKPDGYKLIKFKERMLSFLEEGTYLHTVTAFWEYVLLLEICYKIIEKDKKRYIHDHMLYEGYRSLSELYNVDGYDSEGDFLERMSVLMEKIYSEYEKLHKGELQVRLTSAQVTELIHKHNVKQLRNQLISYMDNKGSLWLLFDNIDNGWPTSGLEHGDLIIIRALIDATRKIEREFSRNNLNVKTAVFLRKDVYELLVRETSDRGKEASVLLDWTDPDLLRELIRLRIVVNGLDENIDFQTAWLKIFDSHYKGEETSQYLIDRSLMRPRFLLNLINHCKSFAINLNHETINSTDIEKGLHAYSSDLLKDIGYELRDVATESDGILYLFIGSKSELSVSETMGILSSTNLTEDEVTKAYNLLLWYGFLGVRIKSDDPKYIYDFNYNKNLMDGIAKKDPDNTSLIINQAFWPALMINS